MKPLDLTGQRFGNLVAISVTSKTRPSGKKLRIWLCQCDCGNTRYNEADTLRSGHTKSCGCWEPVRNLIDLSGRRFGKLAVQSLSGTLTFPSGGCSRTWLCLCDCGNAVHIGTNNLTTGNSKSCGCGRIEAISTHRKTKSSEFRVWQQMIQRCDNPKTHRYDAYGGRGIKFCMRWLSFENFLEDMGPRPSMKHTLDRRDNDGDYEPSNCRWATKSQQARNRRANIANPSGIVGVSWHTIGKKWQARIWGDGKSVHLGLFPTAQRAAEVRKLAEREYWQEGRP